MTTDERLARLEERFEVIETFVNDARVKFEAFAKSPMALKMAAMFGVDLK